ncbi:hypothetical protein F2Q69_00026996 [Brassica cretica]|uniref:Kinesin motor domain-containing protein n=1 Tax=Brassica cretica TaxID=69181 RepID=A0A8S9RTT0_BRACR|nr:hypothetical protein F2Q69_00026996 [Brassica cretica]
MRTPGTPLSKTDRTPGGSSRSREEKIVVTVRLRPLNKKEQLAKDQVAWECVDDHTIVSKPQAQERSHHQSSFTFDKVFGPESVTEDVYENGVKNVALSALMGINATIFAYGQTSSGKTYTMRGVTEKAVNDIYNHIINKGTVVEKLVEETANNDQHLRHLISICEAQRQVGETALNDTSSRSHQIIRLCESENAALSSPRINKCSGACRASTRVVMGVFLWTAASVNSVWGSIEF